MPVQWGSFLWADSLVVSQAWQQCPDNHGLEISSMAGAGGCYHLKWAVANFQILGRLIAAGGSGHPSHSTPGSSTLQSPAWPCYAVWWDRGLNSLSIFLYPTSLVFSPVHQLETLYSHSCLSRSSCGVKLRIDVPLCSRWQSRHLYSHVLLHVGSADFPLKSGLLSVLHGAAAFVAGAENKLPGFQLLHLE